MAGHDKNPITLLSLYNGHRGKLRWLGKFFYLYYPAHLALIGLITHTCL